jgi:hypothetical protein
VGVSVHTGESWTLFNSTSQAAELTQFATISQDGKTVALATEFGNRSLLQPSIYLRELCVLELFYWNFTGIILLEFYWNFIEWEKYANISKILSITFLIISDHFCVGAAKVI